jgi:hypothetical protein
MQKKKKKGPQIRTLLGRFAVDLLSFCAKPSSQRHDVLGKACRRRVARPGCTLF